ncbi:hypothetical protein BT63DRAFT_438664 [Microthyrium microscopicum]|uniref:P-loop containing nucleoside triphosphate hydrolase protein n=1 Tax=Microthyrium microscopicum TaxID=703497 RepID=A0A6A6UFU0_9PEZI|nr:hypothetical protein BT63DRAFT_438664 [Microthyrium microscopicum]
MHNTTSHNGFGAPNAANSAALMSILTNLIPGLSLFTSLSSEYLNASTLPYFGIFAVIILAYGVTFGIDGPFQLLKSCVTCTAEIRSTDEVYNYLMYWISKQALSTEAAQFVIGTKTNSSLVYHQARSDFDFDKELDDSEESTFNGLSKTYRNWDRMKAIRYTPAAGTKHFRYRGYWIAFTRCEENRLPGEQRREKILLSCFGTKPRIIKKLVQEAQITYLEREGNRTAIYRSHRPHPGASDSVEWEKCASRPRRPLSTVVLDEDQKNMVLHDMEEYLHPSTRRWYSNRGIPYRRGYLFCGPPGTGKTSLCVALAGVLHLRIYVTSLNSNMTEDGLASLFRDLPPRCIVLLEDVDSAGMTGKRETGLMEKDVEDRDKASATKGISLSGLLNIIDGVASSEGQILIMTTNHIEKLDTALLRPGRVDLKVRFTHADKDVAQGLFLAIYSTVEADILVKKSGIKGHSVDDSLLGGSDRSKGPVVGRDAIGSGLGRFDHGKSEEELQIMAERFGAVVSSWKLTPAEIQGYLLKYKTSPEDAAKGLEAWRNGEEKHEIIA